MYVGVTSGYLVHMEVIRASDALELELSAALWVLLTSLGSLLESSATRSVSAVN